MCHTATVIGCGRSTTPLFKEPLNNLRSMAHSMLRGSLRWSIGSRSIVRSAMATASCAGVSVVCSLCGVWLRSWTSSRLRHFQTVCSETPCRSARTHAGTEQLDLKGDFRQNIITVLRTSEVLPDATDQRQSCNAARATKIWTPGMRAATCTSSCHGDSVHIDSG